jgi:hypothetical protein
LRCLEKDPNRRYASVLDFARDLAPFGWGDTLRTAEVDVAPAPQAGHHGTLIVAGDHPDAARLAQMAEAVLGPSRASMHPSIAAAVEQRPSSPVGTKSSSPWSSTNDEPKAEPKKRRTGVVWALVAATGLMLAAALFFLLRGRPAQAPDAALESAASELARLAPGQPAAASVVVETAPPIESTPPLASSAPNIGVTVPSVGTSESGAPAPPQGVPRKPRRSPSDERKSAKERLGF